MGSLTLEVQKHGKGLSDVPMITLFTPFQV